MEIKTDINQSEVAQWEVENFANIFKWEAEWDIKEGYKVVTYYFTDKSKHRFEIPTKTYSYDS